MTVLEGAVRNGAEISKLISVARIVVPSAGGEGGGWGGYSALVALYGRYWAG